MAVPLLSLSAACFPLHWLLLFYFLLLFPWGLSCPSACFQTSYIRRILQPRYVCDVTHREFTYSSCQAHCVFHTGQHSRVVLLQLGTQRPRPLLSHGFCSWGSKLTPAFSICLAACGTWDSETAQLTWPMNDSHGTLTEKDMGKGELVRTDGLCPVS